MHGCTPQTVDICDIMGHQCNVSSIRMKSMPLEEATSRHPENEHISKRGDCCPEACNIKTPYHEPSTYAMISDIQHLLRQHRHPSMLGNGPSLAAFERDRKNTNHSCAPKQILRTPAHEKTARGTTHIVQTSHRSPRRSSWGSIKP